MPAAELTRAGRFALTATWPEGEPPRRESSSGRFTLHVDAARQTLDLASPLGTTVARVEVTSAGATLTAPATDGVREVRSRDAEALTQEALGFRLPIGGLPDWIRGRPAPAPAPRELEGDPAAPLAFVQNDWRVRVLERDARGPRRLQLEYPAAGTPAPGTPAVRLLLVVDEDAS